MKLPRRQEKNGGGMILSRGWRKNAYLRSGRLPDPLADLERADPESVRRGGAPTFSSEEFQARKPWRRR